MALSLELKPGERAILWGAVIRNGHGRTERLIENHVPLLRESDILSPATARTPCERIVRAVQLMYVDPAQHARHADTCRSLVIDVLVAAPWCGPLLEEIDAHVRAGRYSRALKRSRAPLAHERELMTHV